MDKNVVYININISMSDIELNQLIGEQIYFYDIWKL